MIAYCFLCQTAYQVTGEPDEVARLLDLPEWKESLPCATPRCLGRAARVPMSWLVANAEKVRKTENIPLETYYRAINGFGRPDESSADLPAVKSQLIGKRITSIDGYSVGDPAHTILNKVVMDDGTMLHFASSTHGACIYAITPPGPTCLEVFDAQCAEYARHTGLPESRDQEPPPGGDDSNGDTSGADQGGEEGGRGVEDPEDSGAASSTAATEPHGADMSSVPEPSPLRSPSGGRG